MLKARSYLEFSRATALCLISFIRGVHDVSWLEQLEEFLERVLPFRLVEVLENQPPSMGNRLLLPRMGRGRDRRVRAPPVHAELREAGVRCGLK